MNDLLILGLDTSGRYASVAVADEKKVYVSLSLETKLTHSQIILPAVNDALAYAGMKISDIEAVAVANGPGSYTGIRIGIATAKAIAYGLKINCAGVSTLEALAQNLSLADGIVCPVMSARQTLLYNALFRAHGGTLTRLTDDRLIERDTLADELKAYEENIILNGDAAYSCAEHFDGTLLAPAQHMIQNAQGIISAAIEGQLFAPPQQLDAAYMQLVKAEKDLLDRQSGAVT